MDKQKIASELVKIAQVLTAQRWTFTDNGVILIKKLNAYFKKAGWGASQANFNEAKRKGYYEWVKSTGFEFTVKDWDEFWNEGHFQMSEHRKRKLMQIHGVSDLKEVAEIKVKEQKKDKIEAIAQAKKAEALAYSYDQPRAGDYVSWEYMVERESETRVIFVIRDSNKLTMPDWG